jgi:plasmid stabilization system protein ParE
VAFRWYNSQRSGLGAEFAAELWRILDVLAVHPELAPIAHRDVRRGLVHRFPYVIYYRVLSGTLEVRACLHQRADRDPTNPAPEA